MTAPSDRQLVADYLLDLYGGDPFAAVREASNTHREAHGRDCGVYPSDPQKMRVLPTLVRATVARRILEIGAGLGYSALWLADAAGPEAQVETIDRFQAHVELGQRLAAHLGLAERIRFLKGEGVELLQTLSGPYDFIHDDGWFAEEPPYFQRMVDLVRPGGLLIMSNWFLLEDAIIGRPQMDWAQFAGPDWAAHVKAYAERLTSHPGLHVSFVIHPWLALAYKAG